MAAELNIFFRTAKGFKAHIKVAGEDETIVGIGQTLEEQLVAGGSTPEEQRPAAPHMPAAPRPVAQGAPGPQGATISRIHQQCGSPMQYVAGGISKAGRPYPAFFKCVAGCLGQNGRQYTENA